MRKFDAHLDFDLALAKSQTPENPAFYIQYCHARIESIKNQAAEKNIKINWSDTGCLAKLNNPMETRVLRMLAQFEDSVVGAEKTLEPYRLVPYLMDLAASFHRFYAENRVISDDLQLTQARLMLATAVQAVVRSGLDLLGVSAPLKMKYLLRVRNRDREQPTRIASPDPSAWLYRKRCVQLIHHLHFRPGTSFTRFNYE